jgi:orotidine-5'-phosphate decarboxylase
MTDASSVRDRLILALDVARLDEARALASELAPYFATVKVGLELFSAEGPDAVRAFVGDGFQVFADLKLHDIPTTVGHAARAIAKARPSYVSVHTAGGVPMLKAALEGLEEGAENGVVPKALGITVLTSDLEASEAQLSERAGRAREAGLPGVVCAAPDLPVIGNAAPGLLRVVPGTRPLGASRDDQARVATPEEAIALGADLLVVGRAVTAAKDRRAAADALHRSLAVS